MVFLVPFDGSSPARRALDRAVEHGVALDENVLAICFVPTGNEYAKRRVWIEPDDDFAAESASATLRQKIEETVDDAERTFADSGAHSMADGVPDGIRRVATEVDASALYVGTTGETAEDGLETPFGTVTADAPYDVHVVRGT